MLPDLEGAGTEVDGEDVVRTGFVVEIRLIDLAMSVKVLNEESRAPGIK